MPKVITSPVKRWSGTVTLSDPLTFPQAVAFEEALDGVKELGGKPSQTKLYMVMLPGILKCVEEWHLTGKGFPEHPQEDNFPRTTSSIELLDWLIGEITRLYNDTEPDPNE